LTRLPCPCYRHMFALPSSTRLVGGKPT